MSVLELLPIGTILSILVDQVISTVSAVNDVLIEKESFKTLSKYLCDIKPILEDLQLHELNNNPCVRQELVFLKKGCDEAAALVQKYSNRGKFYSFLNCRRIAKEIQVATRIIGESLSRLPLANTELQSEISDKVNMLQAEIQKAEYVDSQSRLKTLDKLDHAIKEQKHDLHFINSMLVEIASAVGVSIEPSEIRKELDYLKMEKKVAAARKEKQEEIFLKQVIDLLSQADAARDEEEIWRHYDHIMNTVKNSAISNGRILEYDAFICPINKLVMVDPVNLCTGTTCERAAIEARIREGCQEDPRTGQPLADKTLRPNISVRQSIQQWREQNYCLKIRRAKDILQSRSHSAYNDAFCELEKVIKENVITKDWIAIEGLIDIIVVLLGNLDASLKSRALETLAAIVERHSHNKAKAEAAGVLGHIVECMGLDANVCTAAINLLFELLHENDRWYQAIEPEECRWNEDLCRKLKQQHGAIPFLVICILAKQSAESAKKVEDILLQLSYNDDDTILAVASCHWYKPLAQRLCHGSEVSVLSMMRALERMQLVGEDVKQLGEDGVINPLVNLATGGGESSILAFSIMAKLSMSNDNRRLIIEAGAFSLIFEQIISSHVSSIIREKCSEIFEKLTFSGMEFLNGPGIVVPELELMISQLISVVQNSNTSISIRKPAFRALLGICNTSKLTPEKAIATTDGISSIFPLLEDSDQEIRELALQLIHQISQNEPVGIAELLLDGTRLKAFISFLKDHNRPKLQFVAAGLLANLQKSKMELTKSLAESGAIPVLLNILEMGTVEAKESVLDLLFGFLNPEDIDMQKKVVDLGAFPLLVNILKSENRIAKARAAALISYLSSNSIRLTMEPNRTCYFCFLQKRVPTCEVHGGICSVESSFCLLQANAIPELVRLFQVRDDAVILQTLRALKTLVQEGLGWRGAKALHKFGAIDPMLGVLGEANPTLNEEVLEILERVFAVREVADKYSEQARTPLILLAANCSENINENLRAKAAKLLAELGLYSKSGSMPL